MSVLLGLLGGQGLGFAPLGSGGGQPPTTAYDDLVDATSPDRHLKFQDTGSVVADRLTTDTGLVNGTIVREIDPLVTGDDGGASFGFKGAAWITFPDFLTGFADGSLAIDLAFQLDAHPSAFGETKYVLATTGGGTFPGEMSLEVEDDGAAGCWVRCWSVNDSGTAIIRRTDAASVPIGVPVKVMYRREPDGTQRVAIDGVNKALTVVSGADPAGWSQVPSRTWHFGQWPSGANRLHGILDEPLGWGLEDPPEQEITLSSTLPAFEATRFDVTAESGWPAGRTPLSVTTQGAHAHGFVRRAWKPTDNNGNFIDFQAGGKNGSGTIVVTLDDLSSLTIRYTVVDPVPTAQGGVKRYLDDTAAGGGDGTATTPWNDWTTAIAGLAAGDVLVVSAKVGGGVYNVNVNSGGPSSSVGNVVIVADPVDIAAGRRPRIHLQGGQYAAFHDSPSGLWEADPGSPANTAWRTVASSYTDPGEAVGGLYKTAGGEWKRLFTYTDTVAGRAFRQLRDTTYARLSFGTGSDSDTNNWNTYLGPGIYYNGGRYYIRLDPVPGETVNDPAGAAPTPYPWDWAAYHPSDTDPNNVELMLSSTDAEAAPHNHCLDISSQTGWRIRNIDFVAGGGGIKCQNGGLTLEGCCFFGMAMSQAFEGRDDLVGFIADYLDARGTALVADRCEFWGGWPPWGTWDELKGYWGAYGVSARQKLVDALGAGTSITFRHCHIDGYVSTYWHGTASGSMRHHHCLITQAGMDGFSACPVIPSGSVFDLLRCRIDQGSMDGWTGPSTETPGDMRIGLNLITNARPNFHAASWWDVAEDPVGGSGFIPNDPHEGHGSYTIPDLVAQYGNTMISTNGVRTGPFGGVAALGQGAGLGVYNPGNMTVNGVHRTVNNIAAVVASPHDWVGYSWTSGGGDAHVSVFADAAGVGRQAGQILHDYDHLHRFGTMPAGETRDVFATTIDSGGQVASAANVAAINSATGHEANGTEGDPQFDTTPVWNVDDVTFRTISRWIIAAGSPAATGGNEALAGQGWPDVDFGVEITYPGYAWRGALEPDVPAIEQQVGPLGPMPSG